MIDKRRPLAAHFLLHHELAGSPPNAAILNAYSDLGVDVHIFTPGAGNFEELPAGCSAVFESSYGYSWLAKKAFSRRWFQYAILSGTTEDPLAAVGVLSSVFRIPSFTLADEIKSGSYSGNRSPRWKALCKRGMRQSKFSIVNDSCRIELQREYCGASENHKIMVYPGGFHDPPRPLDRSRLRQERGIADDALVICFSGVANPGNGGDWLPEILKQTQDLHIWGQFVNLDPMTRTSFENMCGAQRLHFEKNRLPWRQCWASMAAADIGLVVYTQDGPQFQNMGVSSNRLCMFLTMGVPVIARRQPSFQFIEEHKCGILVDSVDEVARAVKELRSDLEGYRQNALACAGQYINAPAAYLNLREYIGQTINRHLL